MAKKKSQIFSADMVIAIVTFLFILLASAWLVSYTREKMELSETRNDLEFISRSVLAVLVETPGNPSNWTNFSESDFNQDYVYSIGLARSYSQKNSDVEGHGKSAGLTINNYMVLDETKIQRLAAWYPQKYNVYKRILGILGPDYEFQLSINVWNGTGYDNTYQIGLIPDSNVSSVVRSDRFALFGGNWTNVMLKIWKNCEKVIC